MRIRTPFAGAFLFICLVAAYLGLSSVQVTLGHDKVLHFITFFLLTICFYWILDTSRRRTLHLTLTVCTLTLGIGSEIVQGFLPNGRTFDPFDIIANIIGSSSALGLCSWYHKRMLERRRAAKQFHLVPGEDEEGGLAGEEDLELGEQDSGVTPITHVEPTLEEEVDNWDENAEDHWEEEDPPGTESGEGGAGQKTPTSGESAAATEEADEPKKRTD